MDSALHAEEMGEKCAKKNNYERGMDKEKGESAQTTAQYMVYAQQGEKEP